MNLLFPDFEDLLLLGEAGDEAEEGDEAKARNDALEEEIEFGDVQWEEGDEEADEEKLKSEQKEDEEAKDGDDAASDIEEKKSEEANVILDGGLGSHAYELDVVVQAFNVRRSMQ